MLILNKNRDSGNHANFDYFHINMKMSSHIFHNKSSLFLSNVLMYKIIVLLIVKIDGKSCILYFS